MNGPFLLVDWQPNNVMVLEPNPDYWNAERVNFDRVEIYTVTEDTTQVNMYRNGEIDMLDVPETMYKDFEDEGMIYYEDGANFYIQFTTDGQTDETAKYLANRNFIEAVSAALTGRILLTPSTMDRSSPRSNLCLALPPDITAEQKLTLT